MPTHSTLVYRSAGALRNRSVGGVVLTGTVAVPAPAARLLADWQRDATHHLDLQPGDVEPLPLARARMRWPDYPQCVQAARNWTRSLGLGDLLPGCDTALMACRGARYHHDGVQYGSKAFCNLFLSEDQGLDLHFPGTGQRIALTRGTVVVFDTGQPHAVIARHSAGFNAADFAVAPGSLQFFLTWELPMANARVRRALGVTLGAAATEPVSALETPLWRDGAPVSVCPVSGQWRPADAPSISGLC